LPDADAKWHPASFCPLLSHLLFDLINLTTYVVGAYKTYSESASDRAGVGLSILRDDPPDPDDESSLATACMRIEQRGVAWERARGA